MQDNNCAHLSIVYSIEYMNKMRLGLKWGLTVKRGQGVS